MPYNFRLKEYGNGTLQLTYFHKGIVSKEDHWTPYNLPEIDPLDENGFKIIGDNNPFDMPATLLTQEDEYLVFTDEEMQEKKDRSLRSSLNRSKRMIFDYGRSNVWDWFFTLTFAPVPEFNTENYCECSEKVRMWFKNVRKHYCPELKYLIVPEQHESGAWHFHALVSNCEELTFEIAVNNQKYVKKNKEIVLNKKGEPVPNKYFGEYLRTSYPDGEYIYNILQYKSGFSTATRIRDTKKAVSYIVKYITKDLCECTFGKRRYLPSMNLDLPVVTTGLYPADALESLLQDIEYNYNVRLSIDAVKSYDIDVDNYHNTVTIFEFDVSQPLDQDADAALRSGN